MRLLSILAFIFVIHICLAIQAQGANPHLTALCTESSLLNASFNQDGVIVEALLDPTLVDNKSYSDQNTQKFYDVRFKYCEDFYPELPQAHSGDSNSGSILGDRKKLQQVFSQSIENHNTFVARSMGLREQVKCESDPGNWKDLNKVVSYIGSKDERKPTPSKMYEHIFNATGGVYGYNHDDSKSIRHTGFVCGHPEIVCASYHSICEGDKEELGELQNYKFFGNWENPNDKGIKVDISQSWFGKMGKDTQGKPCKIYGKCPTNVDGMQPVFLRLTRNASQVYPKIHPLKLKVLDTSKFKIIKGITKAQNDEVLRYYREINNNAVVVGYHNESTIDIPEHLKMKEDLKYIQEQGFEFVPINENVDGDWIYIAPKKIDFKHVLLTTGYLTPESSGSPNGQCSIIDNKSECYVTAIHGGQINDCWEQGSTPKSDAKCLNVSQAISETFKNAIDDEVNRINSGRPQTKCFESK